MRPIHTIARQFFSTQRGDFKVLQPSDIEYFQSILPKHSIIQDEIDLQPYNICWRDTDRGYSKLALRPRDTQTVSKILSYCNSQKIAVVPQSGNTGLVGGSVPVFD